MVIPTDSAEGRRSEAWKAFVVVACVCPPSLWDRVEKAAARKVSMVRVQLNHFCKLAVFHQRVHACSCGIIWVPHCSQQFCMFSVLSL